MGVQGLGGLGGFMGSARSYRALERFTRALTENKTRLRLEFTNSTKEKGAALTMFS